MSKKSEIDLNYELTESIDNMKSVGFQEFQLLALARFVEAIAKSPSVIEDPKKRWDLIHETIRTAYS